MQNDATQRPDLEVWWLHPSWVAALMALVLIPASYFIPDLIYRQYWRTPKLIDSSIINLMFACAAAFAIGAFAGSTRPHTAPPSDRDQWARDLPWPMLLTLFNWAFYLSVFGYVVWTISAVMRGMSIHSIIAVFQGDKSALYTIKDQYLVTISGITTMNQFALGAVVIGVAIGVTHGWHHTRRKIIILFLLSLLRVVFNMERLALIELTVPLVVIWLRLNVLNSPRMVGLRRALVVAAPIYSGVALLLLFSTSEYFRTWRSYYAEHSAADVTFPEFASARLLGYYVTAINNGAIIMNRLTPTGSPYFTLHFLWRLPLVSGVMEWMYPNLPFGKPDDPFFEMLEVEANREFNNPGGYLLPILDFGITGGLLYWLVLGLLCGWLYRLFCLKHPIGLFVYPISFIGIIDFPRIFVLGDGRLFPGFLLMWGAAYVCIRAQAKAAEARATLVHIFGHKPQAALPAGEQVWDQEPAP